MMRHPTTKDHERLTAQKLIRQHEGVRSHPYIDSVGKVTIGSGVI